MEQTGIPEVVEVITATTKLQELGCFSDKGYCQTPEELAAFPEAQMWMVLIANEDAEALSFMRAFWDFEHMFDDLYDRDKEVSCEAVIKTVVRFVGTLTFNPFYVRNSGSLFPLIVSTANRWCDSELWRKGTPEQREAVWALKCGDIDLFLHVAYLTGGWEHMRAVRDARSYDKE